VDFDILLESNLEQNFIMLLEKAPVDEWFYNSVNMMIGSDWYKHGLQILLDEDRKDLIPVLNKYADIPEINKSDIDHTDVLKSIRESGDDFLEFQKSMRGILGQDWQPKALHILSEYGDEDDSKKFESLAYKTKE